MRVCSIASSYAHPSAPYNVELIAYKAPMWLSNTQAHERINGLVAHVVVAARNI